MAAPLRIVQAVYDYDAQQDDELSIQEGHLLWLGADASDEPGWLKCTLKSFQDGTQDAVGNVPENYVDEPATLYHAVALYDYEPQADDELTVYEGSPLDILQECPDGEWAVARFPTDQGNFYGLVPKSYIEPSSPDSTPPQPQPQPQPTPVAPITPIAPAAPATSQPQSQHTPAPSAPNPSGPPRIATALYDYEPQQDDELDIREGETCMILVDAELDPSADPDWCLVRLVSSKPDRSGKEGLVPLNYLEIKTISKSPAAMLTSSPAAAAAAAAAASVKPPPLPPQPTVAIPPTTALYAAAQSPTAANGTAPPPLPPTPSATAQRDAQLQLERERAERERAAAAAAAATAEQEKQRHQQEMDAYQRQLAAEEERARHRREEERLKQEEAERQRAVTAAATAAANAKPPGLPPRPPALPDRPSSAAVTRVAAAVAVSAQNTGSSAASSSDRPDPSQVRVWLDASGIHKTEAAFVDLADGKVKLFKTNGVKIDVPITALSPQDQATAYKLKGLPVPAHLSSDGSATAAAARRATSPALPSPRATSAAGTASSADGATTYNGMDWAEFLVAAGVELGEARGVAQRFAAEKLDESTVPDLNRDILKGLGVREGDILRILKYQGTYRTKREREQALEAENLARIESYAKSRGGLVAGMAGMSIGSGRAGGADQLKEDEELARRLQQEELLKAGVSSVPIPPTQQQQRRDPPPAAARRTTQQQSHPAAASAASSTSSATMSAALAARRQSAPQTTGTPGINPRLGAPPPMPTIAQAVSAVPAPMPLAQPQQQQPMRPANVPLPAPLIPTNTPAAFVPTAVTGPTLAQQQQMQQQQLAQQHLTMQQQQQQQQQAQNQANMMMLASAMMSGQRPGVSSASSVGTNSTGRAQWQNATPDNPFGKPLAATSTGSSSSAMGMGMSRSISQPAHMSLATMATGNPSMMAAGATGAMQFAHQNPAMAHMMVQQGVGFAQQNPQLMHQAAGMAVQHGPGMMHQGGAVLAASMRPGMPGMQGPMMGQQQQQQQQQPGMMGGMGMMGQPGMQQQQDQYAAFRQFQGQR